MPEEELRRRAGRDVELAAPGSTPGLETSFYLTVLVETLDIRHVKESARANRFDLVSRYEVQESRNLCCTSFAVFPAFNSASAAPPTCGVMGFACLRYDYPLIIPQHFTLISCDSDTQSWFQRLVLTRP